MALVTKVTDLAKEEWVPCEDETDVDPTISFDDINKIETSCTMYSFEAAAKLEIEGIGGGSADVQSSFMILDYVATRAKRVDGVGKRYGFGARVVVKMTGASADAHANVTGIVADAHAGKISTDVRMRIVGLSSPKIVTPTVTKLDIDGYAQLIGLTSQIETILSLRDKSVITLNPTLLAKTQPVAVPSDDELLRSSYRLIAMTGIEQGRSRDDWGHYMLTGGTRKLKDAALFTTMLAEMYELAGISDNSKPNASQISAALERTDGIYASRKDFN